MLACKWLAVQAVHPLRYTLWYMCRYNATNYAGLQCAPGYEGPLCATCSPGYGFKKEQCMKCMSNIHLNTFYYALITFVGVISLIITTKVRL